MGFMRLTPENAITTWIAGISTFVLGGAGIFLVGASGAVFAAHGVIAFRWEQAALMMIGAVVAGVGVVIPRKRSDR
jgi:hypothetical protein